jgi:hypothetical protein
MHVFEARHPLLSVRHGQGKEESETVPGQEGCRREVAHQVPRQGQRCEEPPRQEGIQPKNDGEKVDCQDGRQDVSEKDRREIGGRQSRTRGRKSVRDGSQIERRSARNPLAEHEEIGDERGVGIVAGCVDRCSRTGQRRRSAGRRRGETQGRTGAEAERARSEGIGSRRRESSGCSGWQASGSCRAEGAVPIHTAGNATGCRRFRQAAILRNHRDLVSQRCAAHRPRV